MGIEQSTELAGGRIRKRKREKQEVKNISSQKVSVKCLAYDKIVEPQTKLKINKTEKSN